MRKLKTPSGELYEQYIASSCHFVEDGEVVGHNQDSTDGYYTGVFWFTYPDGHETRHYSEATAPAWMLELYEKAMEEGTD